MAKFVQNEAIQQDIKFNIDVDFQGRAIDLVNSVGGSTKEFNLLVSKELTKKTRRKLLEKIQTQLGQLLIREMRARIKKNKQYDGSLMPKLSKKYKKAKARIIKKKPSYLGTFTKFKAKKVNDKTRLTGQLMTDLSFERGLIKTPTLKKDGFIVIRLYVKDRSLNKGLGLIRMKREFFGFGNKELKLMKKKVLKRFNKL